MTKIRIETPSVSMTAILNDSATAKKILKILPIEVSANRWGKEVYFSIPLKAGEEDPQPSVSSGALGYWPPGNALCIFFGQTPYSPVNVVGFLDGDPGEFAKVKDGDAVKVVKEE